MYLLEASAMEKFPREFYLMTGMATLIYLTWMLIQPVFPLYVVERGASPLELGLIVSLLSYTTLVARVPLGMAMSRFGSWWVLPLALVGQPTAYILYSLVSNPAHFYPIRVFHALALAAAHPALISLVSRLSPEGRRGEGVGLYLTSVGLSMMGGPLLGGLLLSYLDYRGMFVVLSVIPLCALGIYLTLIRRGALGSQLSRGAKQGEVSENLLGSLRGIVTLRPVQVLTYLRLTFSFTYGIMDTVYAVYAVNILHLEPAIVASLFSIRGLTNTLARAPSGRLSDIIGRKKPLILSFSLLALVYFLFSEAKDPIMISVAMLIFGAAHGIRAVSEWAFLGDVVPRESEELANAYFTSAFDLGRALGSTFAGLAAMMMPTPTILMVAVAMVSSSVVVIGFTNAK